MKWHAFRNEETTMRHSRQFSQQAALDLIRQTQAELDQTGTWPDNLTSWLQENHPAVSRTIRLTAKGINSACQNQDITGLISTLAEYKATWIIGFDLWREYNSNII